MSVCILVMVRCDFVFLTDGLRCSRLYSGRSIDTSKAVSSIRQQAVSEAMR